ncbi:putative protein phosphatase 2C 49 [Silene latifolia]|uniref:putative protein phosphatase 2C 49 n=1 Tax=Silene latifolia TaxID=37657 RepID=UPI003D781151
MMGAEAEVVCPTTTTTTTTLHNIDALIACSQFVKKTSDAVSDNSPLLHFVPTIRSGSFADIGPRRCMEDEHILIDDLSMHLPSLFPCPKPSAFYGVFDGHGGPEAAAYVSQNMTRLFFQDSGFLESSELENILDQGVENCLRRAFQLADLALAEDCTISTSTGTTALTALLLGRVLVVANAGDCRAVLCRKGEAIDMSKDHRPTCPSEKRRVEEAGGYVEDGYVNGVLSVSRALGDWDLKLPKGSTSPLIAEPEVKQVILTEEDEFLIIGCDGVWDVMSSQQAVSIVRRGLRRHNDPEQCAKEVVREALRLNTYDNLTVVVVCFSSPRSYEEDQATVWRPRRFKCRLSSDTLTTLQKLLDGSDGH